jgi:hypothetical protein
MPHWRGRFTRSFCVLLATLAYARVAFAIPAFARKYETSCLTCHTIYPKLNPFGEAFRRNGYRFPGVDSDYVKQRVIALGQEAQKVAFPNAVWPGTLPGDAPLSFGFNGQAVVHPDRNSGGAQTDHGSLFSMQNLVAEGHVWAGGSFDDTITFFAQLTVSDNASLEEARVLFNDLLGPAHAVNVVVGRGPAALTSFGPHSSYLNDTLLPVVPVTALFGATSAPFNIGDHYNGVEVNGVLLGSVNYALGATAGANLDVRPTDNFYAHLGYKLGGLSLDGIGSSEATTTPWAENALTLDLFTYRSASHFTTAADALVHQDTALTLGGSLRAQWGGLELNAGILKESHDHASADNSSVVLLSQYDELSYVVFPWLVPAVRLEYTRLTPDGGAPLYDCRLMPGIAALIRANIKVTVMAQIEWAEGAPIAGWGAASGLSAPSGSPVVGEVEGIFISLVSAF